MPSKKNTDKVRPDTNHYVSVDGNKNNDGTIGKPWDLSFAASGAKGSIKPGDTVLVRGGTYHSETGYTIVVSGDATDKITFKAYPGETVILDGSIPEFTNPGNNEWEPYPTQSSVQNVYRSVKDTFDVTGTTFYGGFINIDDKWYSLAPHKSEEYLTSETDEWRDSVPRYLGPGISQKKTKTINNHDYGYILIRLDNSDSLVQLGRPVPQISDPDPGNHSIYICSSRSFGFTITGSHLVVEGFAQINHFYSCFLMSAAIQTDITIRNCGGHPIHFGARCGLVDGLTFDSCKFYAHMPGETWWVAYADIKAGDAPADHVRKCGLDLGKATNVKVVSCVLEEFFDGILASADYNDQGVLTAVAHDVEVHHTTFKNTWDDAWQMIGPLYHINFHHNFCFGAGPSVDAAGTDQENKDPGTVYIHHNVIDTTTSLVFWGRGGFDGKGMYESIPLSSHGSPDQHTWPRKLYYNTIVTGPNFASYHPYVGWFLFGAKAQCSQARHEVYNNIFLVKDGRPGGRDFDAIRGREIYDGNVYWNYQDFSPWRFLQTSTETIDGNKGKLVTVTDLRNSQAFNDSQVYYPPGWESSGLSVSPRLDRGYRPRAASCQKGAVNLTKKCWPGTEKYEAWRGAINPKPLVRKKTAKK